ncbi:hypothetical protein ACLILY_32005, partial [Mycobacterium sp. MS3]
APAPNPYGYPRNPTVETDPLGLMPCPTGETGSVPTSGFINPHHVRFTQDSIGSKFSNGASVQEFIGMLESGRLHPTDVPPIRIVEYNEKIYSFDNRRLWAYQQAGVMEIPFKRVPIEDNLVEWGRKFGTKNDGVSVRVRGRP